MKNLQHTDNDSLLSFGQRRNPVRSIDTKEKCRFVSSSFFLIEPIKTANKMKTSFF